MVGLFLSEAILFAVAALAGFVVAMPLSYLIASKIAREKATNRVA